MLHVCASAALYRPLEMNGGGADTPIGNAIKSPEIGLRNVASSGGLLLNTNTTYLGSTDEPTNRKYIEHLFLEESKNRLNDYYNTNKFGKLFGGFAGDPPSPERRRAGVKGKG